MGLFTERDEETPNEIIIGKLNRIEAKLDAVIKAMHDYDGNDEYGESSFEAFMDDEEAANKRMDIIGQNGNEGSHYVTNEEADEDANNKMRVGKDKNNDIQDKRTGGNKKKYKGKRKFTQDLIPKNK
jgi:hypothetical protein